MTAIKVEIPGHLLPWQRAVRTKSGRVLTTEEQRSYQASVRFAWMQAHQDWLRSVGGPGRGWATKWPVDQRYAVAIVVTWADERRRDLDNASKTLLDALNGLAWEDDSQVDALLVLRTTPDGSPAARVVVSTMGVLGVASILGWWAADGATRFVGRLAGLLGGGGPS